MIEVMHSHLCELFLSPTVIVPPQEITNRFVTVDLCQIIGSHVILRGCREKENDKTNTVMITANVQVSILLCLRGGH